MSVERKFSISALVGDSISNVRELAQQELAQVRQDVRAEINAAKASVARFALIAGVLTLGALLLVFAVAQALADALGLPHWAGYSIVGLALSVGGYLMLRMEQKQQTTMKPIDETTIATEQENQLWSSDHPIFDKTQS